MSTGWVAKMNIRQATPQDVGELAYMIMTWSRNELPEEVRIMDATAVQAERTAKMIVYSPGYLTRVMENGSGVVGAYVIMCFQEGTFGDEPYGSLLGVYVRPECRGHKYYGLKLLMDAEEQALRAGLARLEINPMPQSRGLSHILRRMGYAPLCITHTKRFSHV